MTRIVTRHYRYKPPPRKRKAVALEAPAVVAAKRNRRPGNETAAEVDADHPSRGVAAQPSTPRAAARVAPPANDDRKSVIVTARRRGKRFGDVPDLTPEKLRRRSDAADALWRELVRRATGNAAERD